MDLGELTELAERERASQKAIRVRTCTASSCLSSDGLAVKDALVKAVVDAGLSDRVHIAPVGCMRLCCEGPLVQVDPAGTLYEKVTPADAASILAAMDGGQATAPQGDPNRPFFTRQVPIVLENCGYVEPERIETYLAAGGYLALHQVLRERTPAQVLEEVRKSGLRGRGGAGYPTGVKWGQVAKQPAGKKYVVCNADEGDPGAFMDRSVLESDPHRVLVSGPARLFGERLESPDIRAGMAMLIASLAAEGVSVIGNVGQIDRGYERIDQRLRDIGADIERVRE